MSFRPHSFLLSQQFSRSARQTTRLKVGENYCYFSSLIHSHKNKNKHKCLLVRLPLCVHSVRFWKERHQPSPPRRRWLWREREVWKSENPIEVGQFKNLINQCYKIIHPDQISAYGQEYAAVNSDSWTKLTELINIINVKHDQRQSIPNQAIYHLKFYIKPQRRQYHNRDNHDNPENHENPDEYSKPKLVEFKLRLSGGRCPELMKAQMQVFFKALGMKPYQFDWGAEYWQTSREKQKLREDEQVRKEDTEFAVKEQSVQKEEYRQFGPMKRRLNKLKFWKKT